MTVGYRGAEIQAIPRGDGRACSHIVTPETFWNVNDGKGSVILFKDVFEAIAEGKRAVDGFIELNRGKTACK
jgi:hypothetical protein